MLVSKIDKENLLPVLDIIIYKSNEKVYAEYAEIKNNKIRSYKPLSYQAFQALVSSTGENSKYGGFVGKIPDNVLDFSTSTIAPYIVWVSKREYKTFLFNNKKGKFYYPNMIFKLHNNELYIYVSKTLKIDNNTLLYKSPFPNIYSDQKMCFGNMKINDFLDFDYLKTMKNLENAFFSSKFTNTMMAGTQTKSPTLKLLRKLINKNKLFPTKELIPYKSLIDVLN